MVALVIECMTDLACIDTANLGECHIPVLHKAALEGNHVGKRNAQSCSIETDFSNNPFSIERLAFCSACSLQLAACSVQRAACSVQRAACSVQRAALSVHRAACSVHRSAFNVQRSLFSVQRAACSVQN